MFVNNHRAQQIFLIINARQQTTSTSSLRGFVAHIYGGVYEFNLDDLNHPSRLTPRALSRRAWFRRRQIRLQSRREVFVLQ